VNRRGGVGLDARLATVYLKTMNIERIRKLVTTGFKPFTIYLSDGRKFAIPHPEFIAVGKRVVVVIGKNEQVNTVDPLHIVSLEGKLAHK
jgi:hypothetical protein